MPNHITTILTIEDLAGTPLDVVRKAFINGEGQIDFNMIVEMPKCLHGFEPHSGITTRAEAALGLLPNPETLRNATSLNDLTKRLHFSNAVRDITTKPRPEDIPLIARAVQNYAECGYTHWYDWCVEKWGTKWNCYGQPESGHPANATSFKFETAWSHPRDLIKKISERLPGVVFHVEYADEDIGSNCGQYRIRSGESFDEDIAPRHDEQSDAERRKWAEFAFLTWYGRDVDPASRGYGDDWTYSDEVYEQYKRRAASAN